MALLECRSLSSPHTGWQDYQDGVKRIPTACITVEDAELMWRMAQRGQKIVVRLTMGAKTLPDADSFNTVAEIRGWQHPEQVFLTLYSYITAFLTGLSLCVLFPLRWMRVGGSWSKSYKYNRCPVSHCFSLVNVEKQCTVNSHFADCRCSHSCLVCLYHAVVCL